MTRSLSEQVQLSPAESGVSSVKNRRTGVEQELWGRMIFHPRPTPLNARISLGKAFAGTVAIYRCSQREATASKLANVLGWYTAKTSKQKCQVRVTHSALGLRGAGQPPERYCGQRVVQPGWLPGVRLDGEASRRKWPQRDGRGTRSAPLRGKRPEYARSR